MDRVVYQGDGVRVVDTDTHRLLMSGAVTQSSVELGTIRSGLPYVEGFHIAVMAAWPVRRVLFLGGGGCVAPAQFRELYSWVHVDVVEINPEVAHIARRYFWYESDITVEDCRDFVARVPDLHYDVVIFDAYNEDGVAVRDLDLKRIGRVVMSNSLDGSGEGTRFRVPGARQVLRMTGGALRLGVYNSTVLPNLLEIYNSAS